MKALLIRPRPDSETIGLQHVMICEPLELEYLVSNVPEDLRSMTDISISGKRRQEQPAVYGEMKKHIPCRQGSSVLS